MKNPASRNILAVIALLSIGAAIPSSSHAGTFSDSLTNGLNPNYYSVDPSTADVYTETAGSTGIQLAKVADTSGFQEIDIDLNLPALGGNVTGDFSVQINFANALIGPNDDQIQLNTTYANGASFDDVYDLSSGLNVHVYDGSGIENPQLGLDLQWHLHHQPHRLDRDRHHRWHNHFFQHERVRAGYHLFLTSEPTERVQ